MCFLRKTCLLQLSEEKDEVWSVGEEFEKRKRNDSQGLWKHIDKRFYILCKGLTLFTLALDEDEDDDRTVASRSTTKDKKDFIAVNSSPEKSGTTFNSNTHSNSINPSSIGVITTTSDGWRVYNKQSLEEDEDGTGGEGWHNYSIQHTYSSFIHHRKSSSQSHFIYMTLQLCMCHLQARATTTTIEIVCPQLTNIVT